MVRRRLNYELGLPPGVGKVLKMTHHYLRGAEKSRLRRLPNVWLNVMTVAEIFMQSRATKKGYLNAVRQPQK